MSLDGKLEFIGVTDVGRKRAHNEDSIGSDTGLGIAVLADGMGGYRAGEVASAMAVDTILEELRENLRYTKGQIDEETGFSEETLLVKKAIEKALIPNQRREDPEDNFYGSWDPAGPWGTEGGRVYSTALCTLILEVYYRYFTPLLKKK